MTEPRELLSVLLERTCETSTNLAQERCTHTVCSLSKVSVAVVETPKVNTATSYFDVIHAVSCSQKADCHFARNPLQLTKVVADSAQQAYDELQNTGFVDPPGASQQT